jgi:diguanylate cyclase (GGDEF)-like protein
MSAEVLALSQLAAHQALVSKSVSVRARAGSRMSRTRSEGIYQSANLLVENVELRQQIEELQELADRDPLTGALNRRAFMRELERVVRACERGEGPASVVYIDLNSFKAINDTYGHAIGDAALNTVAGLLSANVRCGDVVGRLGGDEFAVVLWQEGGAGALMLAHRLAAAVEAHHLVADGQAVPLRIAVGVRTFETGLSAAEMLSAADIAMFVHKALLAVSSVS